MAVSIVFTQLCVLMTFLLIGLFVRRKGFIHDIGIRDMSWVIVNIGNPFQILSSVLNSDVVEDKSPVIMMFYISLAVYGGLILIGFLMGRLVGAPQKDWKFYNMMTIFGNLGFIGIPLVQAVYGAGGVIYVVVFILIYNLLMFSYGMYVLRPETGNASYSFRNLLSPGFIASVLTIIFFFFDIRLPSYFSSMTLYGGEIVIFLATFIIGANLADIDFRSLVSDVHVWFFIAIRQVALPVLVLLVCRHFVQDRLLLGALAICLAVPVGNVNSMIATNNGLDLKTLTKGTVLTTILSVATVTFVTLFA